MSSQYDDFPRRSGSATETIERLASIETRMHERWASIQREFQRIDRRLGDIEYKLRNYTNGTRSLASGLKDQQWLLIAALVLGAMLGKAGFNPLEWILR